jgi:hypothetical protein
LGRHLAGEYVRAEHGPDGDSQRVRAGVDDSDALGIDVAEDLSERRLVAEVAHADRQRGREAHAGGLPIGFCVVLDEGNLEPEDERLTEHRRDVGRPVAVGIAVERSALANLHPRA